jgi:hypothetical protein
VAEGSPYRYEQVAEGSPYRYDHGQSHYRLAE